MYLILIVAWLTAASKDGTIPVMGPGSPTTWKYHHPAALLVDPGIGVVID